MRILRFLIVPCLIVFIAGCQTVPLDIFKLSPDSLENRQRQTRQYETTNEEEVLAASAGVLQDLGYLIDESETEVGLISASKDRGATNAGQIALATLATAATAMSGTYADYYAMCDKNQKIKASLVTNLSLDGSKVVVRVTFQRIVWNRQGSVSRVETIKDVELYQGFFEKLSKSIFLEEQKI